MFPVYRHQAGRPFEYPREVCRTMYPQVSRWASIAGYHFKLRHQAEGHRKAARAAAAEARRIDRGSGYSIAASQLAGGQP